MKSIQLLVLGVLTLITLHGKAQEANNASEINLIRNVLTDYIEGTANGQPDRLRRAFHPDFNLYTVNQEDKLGIISGADYIGNVRVGEKNSRRGRILSIDYDQNIATAKVEVLIPGQRVFTDHFLLLKYEGSWKIVHKSFTWKPVSNESVSNERIDEMFAGFDTPDHPAVAATFIHKGQVIYKKAFGSAILDHKVPASVDTKFQLAGLSKHFTAFAILLLEEQGKLSLNDDIRKYLPELPEYDKTITVNNLLSMTSGLPDFWTLKNIAGWHRDDVFTQEHAMELIKKSKPAFNPGDDYIYSNTDPLLLSEIVAAVSGQSFASFLKQEVFAPLGMTNTVVADDFEQFIPNIAASYEQAGEAFKRSALNYGITGPTNVYSSIEDMSKWELNLQNPVVGTSQMVKKMLTACTLNDGSTIDPLFGRVAYGQHLLHMERGVLNAYQMGFLGGYSTSIFRFLDQEFTAIVLSSGIPYSGYLGMRTAYMFLDDHFTEPAEVDFEALQTKKLSKKQLEQHTGVYWVERSGYSRTISVVNDTLTYMRGNGQNSQLLPLSDNEFQMISPGDEKIIVSFNTRNGQQQMNFIIGESDPVIGYKQKEFEVREDVLQPLAGAYYCESLNALYEFSIEEGQLVAQNNRAGKVRFKPIRKDLFEGDQWFFSSIQFNEDGKGFSLSMEDVRYLWFEKLK